MIDFDDKYALVIDTDSYAGSFEREMVAYMSGQVGECGVGACEAKLFKLDCPNKNFSDVVKQEVDENGCRRPATIWRSPGHGNFNSVAMILYTEPTEKNVTFWVERAKFYLEGNRKEWKTLSKCGSHGKCKYLGGRIIRSKRIEEVLAIL